MIGNGESLDQDVLNKIIEISKMDIMKGNEQTPACFIKAFHQIIIKNPTNTKDLFLLFKD